jgi:hypothetical protein
LFVDHHGLALAHRFEGSLDAGLLLRGSGILSNTVAATEPIAAASATTFIGGYRFAEVRAKETGIEPVRSSA